MKAKKFYAEQFETEFPDAVSVAHNITINNHPDTSGKIAVTVQSVLYANQKAYENRKSEIGREDKTVLVSVEKAEQIRKTFEDLVSGNDKK